MPQRVPVPRIDQLVGGDVGFRCDPTGRWDAAPGLDDVVAPDVAYLERIWRGTRSPRVDRLPRGRICHRDRRQPRREQDDEQPQSSGSTIHVAIYSIAQPSTCRAFALDQKAGCLSFRNRHLRRVRLGRAELGPREDRPYGSRRRRRPELERAPGLAHLGRARRRTGPFSGGSRNSLILPASITTRSTIRACD